MTEDQILYELITKLNLNFIVAVRNSIYTRFCANNLTIQQNHDSELYDRRFVVVNAADDRIYLDELDIPYINAFYDMGMKKVIRKKKEEIELLEDIHKEQYRSRIPKAISHIIGIPYEDLKVVGGNELIYVSETYNNSERQLKSMAKHFPLLERYLKENDINQDARVIILTPEEYKRRFPISDM